ncbi:DUF397 domain-containing protein [Streptomyces sp. NPDC017991]|uniref:DUF397 domain-containing protein n=1 Tax=Streptomyces sp. NPDC017991 TaxID=3365026 RepID=UPI00379137F1
MPESNFIKSSYSSSGGECVEVALNTPHTVAVRDSKTPDGPILHLSPAAWAGFIAAEALADARRR